MLGLMGKLPRVGTSTRNEGTERRYFYGSVWAVSNCPDAAAADVEGAASQRRPYPDRGTDQVFRLC